MNERKATNCYVIVCNQFEIDIYVHKAESEEIMKKLEFANSTCPRLLKQYIEENSNSFPMLIGQNWVEKKKSHRTNI